MTEARIPRGPAHDLSLEAGVTWDPWEAATIDEGERRDSWLLNYIDILTLLLTLFVLLLALQPKEQHPPAMNPVIKPAAPTPAVTDIAQSLDTLDLPSFDMEISPESGAEPITAAADAGRQPFVQDLMPAAGINPIELFALELRADGESLAPETGASGAPAEASPPGPSTAGTDAWGPEQTHVAPTPTNVAPSALTDIIAASGLSDYIEVSLHSQGVHLEVRDNILFAPGSATLKTRGKQLLAELAQTLRSQSGNISVEGHTDNRPIHTARFPSNWELSTGRATAVARYLIDQAIAPQRLQAVGYADTRPIGDNDTPPGRARNRRVSLILELPEAAQTKRPAP